MESALKKGGYISDLKCFIDDLDYVHISGKKGNIYDSTNKSLFRYNSKQIDNDSILYEEYANIKLKGRYYNNFKETVSPYSTENLKLNRAIFDVVGIDRFKLYIDVEAIDFSKFKGKAEMDITGGTMNYITDIRTGEIIPISRLFFKEYLENQDPKITKYGVILKRNKFRLDVTAPVALYNECNLRNINIYDMRKLLEDIKRELKENGIYISYKNSQFAYIEINKNILAKELLLKKYNMLNLLEEQIFGKKANFNDKDTNSLTFNLINSKNIMDLYDKSIELANKYKIYIDKHIYRMEIKLNSCESIKRAFKSNGIDILNTQIDLEETFNEYIQCYFINPIKEGIEQQLLELKELIADSNFKAVKVAYNRGKDNIFDISIFALAMFSKYKELGNSSNFSKDFNKLLVNEGHLFNVNKLKDLEELLTSIKGEEVVLLKIPQNIINKLNKELVLN